MVTVLRSKAATGGGRARGLGPIRGPPRVAPSIPFGATTSGGQDTAAAAAAAAPPPNNSSSSDWSSDRRLRRSRALGSRAYTLSTTGEGL